MNQNYKNWKNIGLPHKMQHLPKDPRGYPVPYVVLHHNNKYWFAVNDELKVRDCHDNKLCTVCGWGLQEDTWLIGGPISAFHPNGIFNDLPVHEQCGLYSLQVCPYLGMHNYTNVVDPNKLGDKMGDPTMKFEAITQHNTKVPFFVFVKIKSWEVTPNYFIKPERPYLHVAFWKDGDQLTHAQAGDLHQAWMKAQPVISAVKR
jgi:hypothetical protein